MAQNLPTILKRNLDGAERVAVLAVGSELRSDDAAGLLVAQGLVQHSGQKDGRPELAIFFGHTAPENLTGEIRTFNPTHLIIVDAADAGINPGEISIVDTEAITANVSGATHIMPLTLLAHYLRTSVGCNVMIIGIQPASCAYGNVVSKTVNESAQIVARDILAALQD